MDRADTHWVDVHRHGKWQSGRTVAQQINEHSTIKFTLDLGDGNQSESVILPMTGRTGRQRLTLCLSSQVGCALGCGFCETAAMGFVRNLTVAEVLDQWHRQIQIRCPHQQHRLHKWASPWRISTPYFRRSGFSPIDPAPPSPSRVAVSTVGRVAGINRYRDFMTQDDYRRVRLAVSVNAPNPEIRRELMPITRSDSMPELHEAMSSWIDAGGKPILIEYVLIPGVNDADDHPEQLAKWLEGIECRVNVIPYNPRRASPWPAPEETSVKHSSMDRGHGCRVHRRKTLGKRRGGLRSRATSM